MQIQLNNSSYFYKIQELPTVIQHFFQKIIHQKLFNEIEKINVNIKKDSSYKLTEADTRTLKEAFDKKSQYFTGLLKSKLNEIPKPFIHKLIEKESSNLLEIENWLIEIIQSLTDDELLTQCGLQGSIESAVKTHNLLKETALQSVFKTKAESIFKELRVELFFFIDHFLNLCIEALGLREIGEPKDTSYSFNDGGSHYAAKYKLEMYLVISLYPSTIFAFLLNYLDDISTALILTGLITAGSILFLICYDRFIRPCPKQCAGLTNLSMKVQKGETQTLFPRYKLHRQIEQAFKKGKHALLVGDTGSGKSSGVISYAQQINQNNCADLIKKTQIFSVNTSSLDSYGHNSGSLQHIIERFSRHENEVVFFFDEIHAAFKQNGFKTNSSDELKTFLDLFPFVIAATTTNECNQYLTDKAFLRRFEIIRLETLSKDELTGSLYTTIHDKQPNLIVDPEAIDAIYKKAKSNESSSNIDLAQSILSNAITKATILNFDQLKDEINTINTKLNTLKFQLLHQDTVISSKEYQELLKRLQEKNFELSEKENEVNKLRKLESCYKKVWQQSFQLTDPSSKRKWLENQALVHLLQKWIQKKKHQLNLPKKLDKELIESLKLK